ncbi:MAG: Alkaline phosphatase synthesis transcriptional regulatory protein PhoP [Dehalococcoidia bacterium]|nr:Alkaline phosphatase synthesis transcriptional regulatory protein PhoP [Bacillota bacterium]
MKWEAETGQGRKILVIDDDPDILEALTTVLESQGYQVATARDGVEGLYRLKAGKTDLIILDLIMPGMNGFAMYKRLKNPDHPEYANIPILLLTALREESCRRRFEMETGMEMAVDDYVEKPILPTIMLQRVEKLLQKAAEAEILISD